MLLELVLKDKWKEGQQAGRKEGRRESRREDIFDLLSAHGEIPEDIRSRINTQNDDDVLKKWLMTAAKADSLDDFRENM